MATPMYAALCTHNAILVCTVFFLVASTDVTHPLHPRGVQLSYASFYKPGETFTCLDGTKIIPFEQVNDDYCDCSDSSDEPGTSACPDGKFFCINKGHRADIIPSSRVDDEICDCCDGSDEYSGKVVCVNRCLEYGKQMREEMERVRQLATEGYRLKQEYSQQGKLAKQEKHSRLTELGKLKTELEAKKEELRIQREAAELPEKEAIASHESWWKGELAAREGDDDKRRAEEAFTALDSNADGTLTAEEAAGLFGEGLDSADRATFVSSVWPGIKDKYVEPSPPPPPAPEPKFDDDNVATSSLEEQGVAAATKEDSTGEEDDDDFDEDDFEDKAEKPLEPPEAPADRMPDYPEQTLHLIKVAGSARDSFKAIEAEHESVVREIETIEKLFSADLGPEDEFYPLKGHCFEYTDREYIYKVCPYEKVTQRPKHGGSETSLGNWGHWSGPDTNKYGVMKFEKGQGCWNGPDRSATITLHCGNENKLTSASEPNRCEYAFDMSTPAACRQAVDTITDWHDEL